MSSAGCCSQRLQCHSRRRAWSQLGFQTHWFMEEQAREGQGSNLPRNYFN